MVCILLSCDICLSFNPGSLEPKHIINENIVLDLLNFEYLHSAENQDESILTLELRMSSRYMVPIPLKSVTTAIDLANGIVPSQ